MKNNHLHNYDSLVRLRKKLKKHVNQQEDELKPILSVADTILSYVGLAGNKQENSAGIPVTEYVFPFITKTLNGLAVKFAKNEKSKKIITSVATISALALSIFVSRKINRYLDKLANGK